MSKLKDLFLSLAIYLLIILTAALACSALSWYLTENPYFYTLDEYTSETDQFRAMDFTDNGLEYIYEFSKENKLDPYMVMAVVMLNNDFSPGQLSENKLSLYEYKKSVSAIEKHRKAELKKLANAYKTIMSDLVYFPLADGTSSHSEDYHYSDSWGGERTYGGKRSHEGTDIMDGENERGFFPVLSMCDGTVENTGWLELGGYRIGIRSKSGAYIYYAHLHSYAAGLTGGDTVKAGELIGFMGDTGYSTVEGTTGNFDVHLHVGIYYRTDHYEELSVNPYFILKYLEKNKLKYNY